MANLSSIKLGQAVKRAAETIAQIKAVSGEANAQEQKPTKEQLEKQSQNQTQPPYDKQG